MRFKPERRILVRMRPHQNRVTATGQIVADPARGLFMGNRGILHDARGVVGPALWRHKAWIICRLVWKDWHREIMQPHTYTELFFLDEAIALAAGHRPCALCRRAAFTAFKTATDLQGPVTKLDARLHQERAIPRIFAQRHHSQEFRDLPDSTVVLHDGHPALVCGDTLRPIQLTGYQAPIPRPRIGDAIVITPETTVHALRAGYQPVLHPSAR